MHRILLIPLLAAVSLYGQVTVTDTLKVAAGNQNFNGNVTITSPPMTYSGVVYLPGTKTVAVSNGAFTTTLWPNVGATPTGTTYRVTYTPRQAGAEPIAPWTEVWEVDTSLCTSPTACTVAQIRKATAITNLSGNVLTNPMTTNGDLIYWNNGLKRLAIGSAGQHLVVSAGLPAWAAAGEPAITAGTTSQYWRGDKTWQDLNKAAVGLGNVENTALSTWAGSASITTVGTLASGSLPWSLVSGAPSTYAPSAHATAHQNGGADEIATATAAANAIPKAGADGKLASGWFPSGVGMVYPGDGVAAASGGAWGTSLAIGTDLQAYDADLAAVAGLSTAGLVARTGTGTAAARTIQAGTLVSVTNGDGVSGDPSIDVDDTIVTTFLSGTADPVGACTMGTKYHRTDTDETWECPDIAWVKQLGSSHVHAAADTTSGTFDAARIPTLAGSKIDSADKVGSGTKFPMATALGTSGNCAQWGAAGLEDAGQPCGTGSGGGTTGLYSGTIDFGSIADGACASSTFTATGLTTGKTLALSLPSGIDAGLIGTALASAADTAQVRLCNFSGAAVDPASATFKVREMDALGYLTGSVAADLGSIPDGGSVTTTITVTGAATGDNVAPGWPSALNTGLSGVMYVSAANTVTVRVFNWSGAAVDPAELTYAAAITK